MDRALTSDQSSLLSLLPLPEELALLGQLEFAAANEIVHRALSTYHSGEKVLNWSAWLMRAVQKDRARLYRPAQTKG